MTRYDLLWQAFAAASAPLPGDLSGAISAQPEAGRLPSPWVTWTLIGLVRHHHRQLWVGEIVTARLGADLKAMARRGALGHPADFASTGVVPGLPEWEYEFHGRGCCLLLRNGERWIRHRMEKFHDRVMLVRHHVPPDYGR